MKKNKLKEDREYQVIKSLDTVELYRIIKRILTRHGLVQIPASKMCGRRIVHTTIHTQTRPQLAYHCIIMGTCVEIWSRNENNTNHA